MTFFQLFVLAVVQGFTEWLPISSSGHLVLVPTLLQWPDQGPLIDAMAHLGTLGALLVYFNKEAVRIFAGSLDLLFGKKIDGARKRLTPDSKLTLLIALATPPGLVMGLLYAFGGLGDYVRSPYVIMTTLAGFGIALWAADHLGKRNKTFDTLSWRDAALIGLAQACAFIPGTSRSGVTMTMARALGVERADAARFGMLAGVPLFLMSGAYATYQVVTQGAFAVCETAACRIAGEGAIQTVVDGAAVTLIPIGLAQAATVVIFSFLAGWAAIWILMNVVVRIGFLPFVIYRLGLAAFLFWWFVMRA